MTDFEEALEGAEKAILDNAIKEKKMDPILNQQLKSVQYIDNKIKWFENKKKEMEQEKQAELRKMDDLLELAGKSSHTLNNGFGVKPGNKRKLEVKDTPKFMKWLKENKEPQAIMEFLQTCMTKTPLKKFCEDEFNTQRLNGEIAPNIDGIEFGEMTYRKLTTFIKKEKKK